MLKASLGAGILLARPGTGRVHLLNASAAELWDRYPQAAPTLAADDLAHWLATVYELPVVIAQRHVADALAAWQVAGLLETSPPPASKSVWSEDWVMPPPPPVLAREGEQVLELAGLAMSLWVDDPELATYLRGPLQSLWRSPATQRTHAFHLTGHCAGWQLTRNGRPFAVGHTKDEALTTVFNALVDHACQAEDRLLVVHGAGLAISGQRAVLLVAPGGSGKTTLATALNADGLGLLSDDVVPVRRDGRLLALSTPICLKPGSWPVLAQRRPDLYTCQEVCRLGQTVRYLPPCGSALSESLELALLLFPRYQPAQPPTCTSLSPEGALQGLIEAEAVIRHLDQAKLEDLARWISAVPSYAITYPDLESGVKQVNGLLDAISA